MGRAQFQRPTAEKQSCERGLVAFLLAHGKQSLPDSLEACLLLQDGRQWFLPLGLHGDGGAFQRGDSINIVSFRSLLSSMNVATSQLLLVAVPKSCINKAPDSEAEDTMSHIWQVLVWSFDAAFYNKFPEFDHKGRPWPANSWRARMAGQPLNSSGYRGFLYAIQADGEYLQNEFGLAGASSEQCCFNCEANKSTLPYNDFRPAALWRATVKKHEGTCPTTHLVSKIPGVVGESFKYDLLHVLEEGVSGQIIANCCFDFTIKPGLGRTQDERLQALFQKICTQYQEQGVDSADRIRRLTMSTFCNPKSKHDNFPSLSGIKARHIRYLIPVFEQVCEEFTDPSDAYTVHRQKCIKHMSQVYEIIDEGGMHLSGKEAQCLKKALNSCLLHYNRLSVLSIGAGNLMWNTTPKFHLAAHIADSCQWMSPKFYSCYAGETMVGHMAALAHSCLNGTAAWQVSTKVCWRYRLGFYLRQQGADFAFAPSDSDG